MMNNTFCPDKRKPRLNASGLCIAFLLLCGATLIWAQVDKPAEPKKLNEMYSGTAFVQVAGRSGNFGLSIYVDSYSTDEEVAQLAQILRDKGSDELLNAVSKLKGKGRLSPTGRVGTDIKVIRVRKTEKGCRIFLVTDRPITFVELYNGTRSRDYQFGVVQLDLDEQGAGEGAMLVATKISFDKENQLELEHYGIDPVRLANVRKEK
jgi:hypothetical protein